MRRLFGPFLALGAVACVYFWAQTPVSSVLGTKSPSDNSYEACFRSSTNNYRAAEGRKVLADSPELDRIARRHSDRMAADGTIYHNDENDSDGTSLPDEYEGSFEWIGENVGMGPSCEAIFEAFQASAGHNENLLDKDYQRLGVGVKVGADGTIYVTLDFVDPGPTSKPKPKPKCTCPS